MKLHLIVQGVKVSGNVVRLNEPGVQQALKIPLVEIARQEERGTAFLVLQDDSGRFVLIRRDQIGAAWVE